MSHEDIFRARILASRYEQLKILLETGGSLLCLGAVLFWANYLCATPCLSIINPKSNNHTKRRPLCDVLCTAGAASHVARWFCYFFNAR